MFAIPNKRAAVGDHVEVTCMFVGDPLPAVSWFIDDRPISSGGRTHIVNKGLENVLVIETVTDGDYGTYQCKGTNRVGTATQDFQLIKRNNFYWIVDLLCNNIVCGQLEAVVCLPVPHLTPRY